jgi:hypothetical protein
MVTVLLLYYRPWQIPPVPAPVTDIVDPSGPVEPQPVMEFTGDPKKPVRLRINFLQVDAEIVSVGVTSSGNMDTTKEPYGIAWYQYGASPGWPVNALLGGHNFWNGAPGSFVYLSYLPPGESVWIEYEDGSMGEFSVFSNDTYDVKDIPASVMAQKDGDTRTTLISCNGVNLLGSGYTQRTVVLLRTVKLHPPATLVDAS